MTIARIATNSKMDPKDKSRRSKYELRRKLCKVCKGKICFPLKMTFQIFSITEEAAKCVHFGTEVK
jgi:hypothetical protein